MNRRQLLFGATGLAAVAVFGGVYAMKQDEGENYTHLRLDTKTLNQYPDAKETIDTILRGQDFAGKHVMVEFIAGWCPYCAALQPEMDEAIKQERAAGRDIARLTVVIQEGDHQTHRRGPVAYMNAYRAYAKEDGIPHVQLWKGGQLYGFFTGALRREQIRTFIGETIAAKESQIGLAPSAQPA